MTNDDITPNPESARRAVQRISRLERRLRQINVTHKSERQAGEVSALKWAIPILEEYVRFKYGKSPNKRLELWKHEYVAIKLNLIEDFGNFCFYCKGKFSNKKLTIDHYIPLSKGGEEIYSNYRLACDKCNSNKASDLPSPAEDQEQTLTEVANPPAPITAGG